MIYSVLQVLCAGNTIFNGDYEKSGIWQNTFTQLRDEKVTIYLGRTQWLMSADNGTTIAYWTPAGPNREKPAADNWRVNPRTVGVKPEPLVYFANSGCPRPTCPTLQTLAARGVVST